MSDTYHCNFCGEDHEVGPKRYPGALFDFSRSMCPKVPEGFIYWHDEQDGKPNGELHRIVTVEQAEHSQSPRVLGIEAEETRLTAAKEQALREIRGRADLTQGGRRFIREVKAELDRRKQAERVLPGPGGVLPR